MAFWVIAGLSDSSKLEKRYVEKAPMASKSKRKTRVNVR